VPRLGSRRHPRMGIQHPMRHFTHEEAEAKLDYTGLPTEAFILPERFLAEHPDFLRKYGRRRGKGRGGSGAREDA